MLKKTRTNRSKPAKVAGKLVRQRDIASALNVSESRVSQMVKDGMPMDSVDAAVGWYLANIKRPTEADETKQDLERRRLKAQSILLENRVARERRELISMGEARDTMGRAIDVIRKGYRSMESWYAVRFAMNAKDRDDSRTKWEEVERRNTEALAALLE